MRLAVWLPLIIHTLLRNVAGAPTLASVRRINLSLLLQHTHTGRLAGRALWVLQKRVTRAISAARFSSRESRSANRALRVLLYVRAPPSPSPPAVFANSARPGHFHAFQEKQPFVLIFYTREFAMTILYIHVRAAAPSVCLYRIFLERRAKRDYFAGPRLLAFFWQRATKQR